MAPRYVNAMLKTSARAAGITKRVHPHGLRHAHATELAAENVPINVISRQLGHSSSAITAKYLDHIDPKQVVETMQKRRWLGPRPAHRPDTRRTSQSA